MPHGVGLAGEAAPRLDFLGGEGEGLALIARERADLGDELGVADLACGDALLELAHEGDGVIAGEELVVLAGEGRHGLAARRGAVLGRDGGAVELGDLHKVGTGPELVLERVEARGELGGVGLGHEAPFFVLCGHCP